jgi:hypothetical protein
MRIKLYACINQTETLPGGGGHIGVAEIERLIKKLDKDVLQSRILQKMKRPPIEAARLAIGLFFLAPPPARRFAFQPAYSNE